MTEAGTSNDLEGGLAPACARAGLGRPEGLTRLTGGATMESWRFSAGGSDYVLRRAPSAEFMAERPFGHDVEAAVIRCAHNAGVIAPDVLAELEPEDGIGTGFIMRALPGTPNPKDILAMEDPGRLLAECAANLARIHAIPRTDLPSEVPVMNYREAIAGFREQFMEAGGDRPIIALGIKWLEDNCPEECEPVLNHGDFRLGNILAQDSNLTGVLDWELAHFGDPHEDLAFGCMAVWRFARYDRPALGLGTIEEYFSAYEANGGQAVDPARFRYWMIHRTVWWALGCLRCAKSWRDGADRTLERAVISRRASEQELDLLMLLEEEAPWWARKQRADDAILGRKYHGQVEIGELAAAVSEWLGTIKGHVQGHDRFQLAVARNALGIIARDREVFPLGVDPDEVPRILAGKRSLRSACLLRDMREEALERVTVDSPKYPALAVARKKWTGED